MEDYLQVEGEEQEEDLDDEAFDIFMGDLGESREKMSRKKMEDEKAEKKKKPAAGALDWMDEPPAADEPSIETQPRLHDPNAVGCESGNVRNVVPRGQFIAHNTIVDHFAIQLPGKSGSYAAITNSRGYFEMRIPREDFADDLCNLDWWHSFSDESVTLQYIVDFE